MTAKEFNKVYQEAIRTDIDWTSEYSTQLDYLSGCGLPEFSPVAVTLRTAATHVRYQGLMMKGDWDLIAVNDCRDIFRKKVTLLP